MSFATKSYIMFVISISRICLQIRVERMPLLWRLYADQKTSDFFVQVPNNCISHTLCLGITEYQIIVHFNHIFQSICFIFLLLFVSSEYLGGNVVGIITRQCCHLFRMKCFIIIGNYGTYLISEPSHL